MRISQTDDNWERGDLYGSLGLIVPKRFECRRLLVIPLIQRIRQLVPSGLALSGTLHGVLEAEAHDLSGQPNNGISP